MYTFLLAGHSLPQTDLNFLEKHLQSTKFSQEKVKAAMQPKYEGLQW